MSRKKTSPKDSPSSVSPHNPQVNGIPSVMLEYGPDATTVHVVELHDPVDTRGEDAEKLLTLRGMEYHEAFPKDHKGPPCGYAAPRFGPIQQKRFLEKLSSCGVMTLACAWTPVTTTTIAKWRKKSKPFSTLYDAAVQQYTGMLEKELMRRAVFGVRRPIFQKGCLVGHERVYSDRLLEITMKKHNVAYRDKLDVDATISGGVLVVAAIATDQQEWEKRYGGLRRPNGQNGQEQEEEQGKKEYDTKRA